MLLDLNKMLPASAYLGKGVFKNSPPGRVSSHFQVAAVRGDSNPLILSEGMQNTPTQVML
ncbi:hypothetical protein CENA302_13805 [Cylindrospermopsis raciborskii CENA302]|uniref:Brix domain-containing protein n=1 Tax=Cylindrospermopsis raciborskii CENA302 TaxID=1170768 RepID=A0A9Q5W7E8_9CYAN|nr:hypothetical protein CENA302_13805 [Cylindrospermopsis raciborskii CENA302]